MPVSIFQYAEPISDKGSSSWVGVPSGGSLASHVDEYPFSSSDSAQSPDFQFFPGLDWVIEFNLRAGTNPGYYSDGWNVLLEAQQGGTSSSTTQNIRVDLKNGSTVLASWFQTLTTGIADYVLPLSPSDAAAIPSGAYSGGWSLLVDALPPAGSPSSYVILYGIRLQFPSVGFAHLDVNSSGSGKKSVGAQSGNYLVLNPAGSGIKRQSGSETSGALILSGGYLKPSP